ncbi:hypothetical protein [Paenibacillus hunanensis]|uniref:Uncharacterized protein n=1 Tax=Paenibacillus hunanensis TaxID=539262 RepID=A0ABU1IXR1_9BACL|nr:hypothetical protein [Paenibacillus hunanensis]MDR6243487.1 hypothetical protein [Paenibacillus hunanensis]GGI98103.1 hypothetical protein GCM10008022_03490 [Paenibacillus hunanensis]
MRKNVITCNMSDDAIEVSVQDAQFYTPPILCVADQTSRIELLLTDEQLLQLEQAIRDYKQRLSMKGAATV